MSKGYVSLAHVARVPGTDWHTSGTLGLGSWHILTGNGDLPNEATPGKPRGCVVRHLGLEPRTQGLRIPAEMHTKR